MLAHLWKPVPNALTFHDEKSLLGVQSLCQRYVYIQIATLLTEIVVFSLTALRSSIY